MGERREPMSVECVHECEVSVRRILLNIQSTADLREAAALYEQAKKLVAGALTAPEADPEGEMKRGLLALYVHMTYRTKEADAEGRQRLLSVR